MEFSRFGYNSHCYWTNKLLINLTLLITIGFVYQIQAKPTSLMDNVNGSVGLVRWFGSNSDVTQSQVNTHPQSSYYRVLFKSKGPDENQLNELLSSFMKSKFSKEKRDEILNDNFNVDEKAVNDYESRKKPQKPYKMSKKALSLFAHWRPSLYNADEENLSSDVVSAVARGHVRPIGGPLRWG